MNKGYFFKILGICSILLLLLGSAALADQNSQDYYEAFEESGIEDPAIPMTSGSINIGRVPELDSILEAGVLLIPNTDDDDVGMYDPFDGTFLGIIIPSDPTNLSTPINAIQGPDNNIYVSDQIEDGVFVYDTSGAYLYTYCDGSDGLDNVKGIAFRNDTLFVTTGGVNDLVAMFDAPHNRLADFIPVSDAWDILFLDDGRSLVCNATGTDDVRLYNADGTSYTSLFTTNFPEQVQFDSLSPGDFLLATFTANQIIDFDLDGTIHQTSAWPMGRGGYRLGNGNILATKNGGVFEIQPGTGNIIETENTGNARYIELFKLESGPPPTGRCCYDDSLCADNLEPECLALNGTWDENLNCTDDPCPVMGRCCYDDSLCADNTEAECIALGGAWDANLNCTDDPCLTGGCDYPVGDVNGSDTYNGLDITYGVAFFKGGADPSCADCPPCAGWFYCGDVNASCSYNGLDITYGVAYFKGGPPPIPCADCPPAP